MIDVTPLLRCHAKRRLGQLSRQVPAETQQAQLTGIVARAEDTQFGRDHRLSGIRSVADFQNAVPLRRYEDLWDTYWKNSFPNLTNCTWPGSVPYFAVTSGTTTGATKYIPCTEGILRSNNRAVIDLLSHHVANRRQSRLLAGKNFMLGGSTDLIERAPGVHIGDLSGIAAARVPRWARPWYFPPRDLALISEWEDKVERLAGLSLGHDIRSVSGTPSWLLIFFDRLIELAGGGRRLIDIYPDLELIVHGGVNFAPYQRRFEAMLEGGHAELREAYAASEGFIAVADRHYGEGLRLNLDSGLFMEFVPVDELETHNPRRHWLANVEIDVNYAIALTTCAGLWAYLVGDTVRFVERDPPRILVTGRTAYTLSAFGEHLIDEEIEQSVTAAADAIAATVTDFVVAALFPEREGERGGHLYIVEFGEVAPQQDRLAEFSRVVDATLRAANKDYQAHRAGGYGLNPPTVRALAPGTFAAWMKHKSKLGGQHKVPRIINDPALLQDLRAFCVC